MLPDQRVQDGFESRAFGRVAEHQLSHARAIERAGGIDERIAERRRIGSIASPLTWVS
jgi:hypothetical protein